jgi:hypothetical protein
MGKRKEGDITIPGPEKRIRQISPKRQAAIEAQKEKHGRERVERYMRLFYSNLLTLDEVIKLLDVSKPVALEILRSAYFDVATPNRDEKRKDIEYRYADIYRKYHRE